MFLKKSRSKNKTYYSIVETYRENGKVKHRILAHLGSLEGINKQQYRNLALSLLKAVDAQDIVISEQDELQELTRLNWGVSAVYKALWKHFGLDDIFDTVWKHRLFEFNAHEAIFLMLLDRLSAPCSKLKTFEDQVKYFGLKEVSLQHLYRSLDLLADSKESIETALFHKNRTLFNMNVDVVFYDVTTFYFESQKENELKGFGFSKDNKINNVQVVLGLLMDQEGRPVGFDLYSGETFEGNTVETALDKLKERFQIGKIIWVSDRGFCSSKTFEALKKRGYEYIIGAKLKSMSAAVQKEVLDLTSYQPMMEGNDDELRYKILEIKPPRKKGASREEESVPERIICTWSQTRANKDKADRQRLLKKAEELIQSPSKVNNKRGAKKYLKTETKTQGLDEAKIKADEAWDGIYGIRSNNAEMSPQDIQQAYHQLWRIEECFRVLKTNLETRPVYHWSEKRIEGHFVLCFIAFLLERTLEIMLREEKIDYSVRKIRESLNRLELSILKIKDKRYLLRADQDELGGNILKTLKIKKPKRFEPIVV